jgi:peptide/nickel transport system permease protein
VVSEEQVDAPRPQGQWALAWRRFRRDRVAVGCGIFLLVLVFAVGPGAPLYEKVIGHGPNDFFPYAVSVGLRPAGPFTVTWDTPVMAGDNPFVFKHPPPPKGTGKTLLLLGADSALGRDEFLRVLYGGRVSLVSCSVLLPATTAAGSML